VDPADGSTVTKPGELIEAELVLGLCDRFHCLPSQLMAEDARLLRWVRVQELGSPPDQSQGGEPGW
jgi:hypothetical protein